MFRSSSTRAKLSRSIRAPALTWAAPRAMGSRRRQRGSVRHKPVRSRVVAAPYIAPARRRTRSPGPLMVPTKWVKFVVALFLLPLCALLSQTFFTSFARATVAERLWAGEEFWFFSLGAILWLIAFFGLPRPI